MFLALNSHWRGSRGRLFLPGAFRHGLCFFVFTLLLLISAASTAQEDVNQAVFYSSLDTGVGSVDEDIYFLALLEQGISWEGLDIRLAGPLRFRVLDRSPADEGVLRNQDWDEPSDYMRIFRSVSYNHRWDDASLSVHLGELDGVGLGHGSLVDHYFNSTFIDQYQGGMMLGGEWQGNGLEILIENIVEPELLVGRVYLAPLAWFSDSRWSRRLQLGGFVGADIGAPYRSGEAETVFVTAGGDVSFRAIDEKWLVVMPYNDVIAMDGSLGLHVGVATDWEISEENELQLSLRAEYRYVGTDYHPAIFNPFYDMNRYHYPVETSDPKPTLADQMSDSDDLPRRHGFMVDTIIEWAQRVRFGCRYDTEGKGRRHWILFRLEVFPREGYSFAAFYGGQDIRGGRDLFSLDALVGLSARGRIWGPFNLFADFTRRWRQREELIVMANEISGGFGILFVY